MQVIKITICLPRVGGSLRLPPLTVGSWASYSQSIEGRLLSVMVQKSESFVCIILYIYILYIFLCVVIWQNDLFLYFISSFYVSKGSTYKGSCSMCSDLWLILLTFAYMFVFTMCLFMHVLTLIFYFFLYFPINTAFKCSKDLVLLCNIYSCTDWVVINTWRSFNCLPINDVLYRMLLFQGKYR